MSDHQLLPPPARVARRGRRLRGIAALLAVLAVLLLLGLFPQSLLRGVVEERLRSSLGRNSSLERLHVVPGKLRADIVNLVIEGPGYRLVIPKAQLSLRPGFLFGNTLEFNSVVVERPHLTVTVDEKPAPDSPPLQRPIVIGHLVATDATIIYRAPSLGGDLKLQGLRFEGGIGEGDMRVTGRGDWLRDLPVAAEQLDARLTISPLLDLKVKELRGRLAHTTFSLSGTLGRLGAIRPDLKLDAAVDLQDLALVPDMPEGSGIVKATGTLKRAAEGNELDFKLSGDDLEVAGWPLDLRRGQVRLDARNTVRFEVTAGTLGGTVDGEGRWDKDAVDARMRFDRIDAAALARRTGQLPVSGALSGDLTAKGDPDATLRVDTRLRAKGAYGDLRALSAIAEASGTFRPSSKIIDLGWTATVDSGAGSGSADAMRGAHVVARGTARGPLTAAPAVQAKMSGTVDLTTGGRVERVPFDGTLKSSRDRWAVDVTGRAFGGTMRAMLDAAGGRQHLVAEGRGLDLSELAPDARGQATFRFEGRGAEPWKTGSGTARVAGVWWRGVDAGDVEGTLEGGLTDGRVSFDAPRLAASGNGRLVPGGIAGKLRLAGTSLAALQPALTPQRPLSGSIDATLDLRVAFANPAGAEVSGTVHALDVATDRMQARTLKPFHLSARNGRFTVDDLDAVGPGFALAGALGFGLEPGDALSGRVRLDTDLAQLPVTPGWTLAGHASGEVTLSGTSSQPRATGLLTVRDVAFQAPGKPAVSASDGQILLEGETMSTAGLTVSTRGGTAVLSGRLPLAALVPPATAARLGMDASRPLDLRVTGDVDLASLPAPAGWTLTGTANGEVTVTGTITTPRLDGLLSVRSATLQSPGAPLMSLADGQVRLAGDLITVSGVTLTANGASLEITGQLPLAAVLPEGAAARLAVDKSHPLDLRLRGDVDLAAMPSRQRWTGTGRVHLDAALAGTVDDPRATGTLTLQGVSLAAEGSPMLTIADGTVELQGDVISTTGLSASVAGGTVTVEGELPLGAALRGSGSRLGRFVTTTGEGDVDLRWEGISIARLMEALRPDRPSRVDGTLAGTAHLGGRLSDPGGMHGDLSLAGTTLQFQQVGVQLQPVTMTLDEGVLTTDGIVLGTGDGQFRLDGGADLRNRTVALQGRGALDLDALSPFLDDASLSGRSEVDVTINGPLSAPVTRGTLHVVDGSLRLSEIREALTAVNGTVVFAGSSLELRQMTADLGGGEVTLGGTAKMAGLAVTGVSIAIRGEDLTLRYPVGGRSRTSEHLGYIKTSSDVDLTLTGDPGNLLLAGTVGVERALYDNDIFVGDGLLAPSVPPPALTPSRFQTAIALDIDVELVNPAVVRNNLAQLEVTGDFVVRGDAATPAPFGRVGLEPGGKLFLQGREFTVTSGALTFNGTLDPLIAVRAETVIERVEESEITVRIVAGGSLDFPTLTLSSDPARSEKELASLIATGRSDVALSSGAWIVGEQAAALLAGKFTREVSRGLMDLGFDTVEIQPSLLARESDPGARFTFGKQVTEALRFIYSIGLNDPEAQYYAAQFRFRRGREFTAKIQRFDTGHTTYGIGQRLRFGGPKQAGADRAQLPIVKLSAVRVEGESPLPERELLDGVRAKRGRKMQRFELLDDADRVRENLVKRGHLEAEVGSQLVDTVAVFSVHAGPLHGWRVDGLESPPDLSEVIYGASYEEEAIEDARDRLFEDLHRRGFLRATVQSSEVRQGGNDLIVFNVRPGAHIASVQVSFPGAAVLSESTLLEAAGGESALLLSPRQALDAIRAKYREEQYLAAEVDSPRVADTPSGVRVVVAVREGPRAVIAAVRFPGATVPAEELQARVGVSPGDAYDQITATAAVQRLRDLYLTRGYAGVRVIPEVVPVESNLDLVFRITEGEPVRIGAVSVTGLKRTRMGLVRRQIQLEEGAPLDPRELSNLERRLLDLGIFSRAVVTAQPGNPAPIHIELEEEAPFTVLYDLRYDSVDQGSALVDAEAGNLLGYGLTVGGRFRMGKRVRETRFSASLPSIGRIGDLTATVFRLDEKLLSLREEGFAEEPFGREDRRNQQGFTLQQAGHFLHPWELLYGYRWQRDFDTSANPETEDVGALQVSAARDTRGETMNPRRGYFLSFSVEGGERALRSDLDFVKVYTQFLLTKPVGDSLTWAQGYRIGLSSGLGDPRLSLFRLRGGSGARAERFRAGGPNTLRGFGLDELGERDVNGDPLGGQAVLILNQELRFRGPMGYGAAVFYDVGNVYPSVRDLGKDLRHTIGAGLRYDSPVGLIRVDVGLPLSRRAGESRYRIHFGFGQAF